MILVDFDSFVKKSILNKVIFCFQVLMTLFGVKKELDKAFGTKKAKFPRGFEGVKSCTRFIQAVWSSRR